MVSLSLSVVSVLLLLLLGKSQSETREKDFFLRSGGRRMRGRGGAKGTLTSIELSMILGEVYGGWELKAEAATACLMTVRVSGAEAERAAWLGFHWGALKLDLRSGNGGGRGRVLRGGRTGTCCGCDCDCAGGGGGGGGWKADCVVGAVRGRSELTRSANDGAVGGMMGKLGMGWSGPNVSNSCVRVRVRRRTGKKKVFLNGLTEVIGSRRAAQAHARPRLE